MCPGYRCSVSAGGTRCPGLPGPWEQQSQLNQGVNFLQCFSPLFSHSRCGCFKSFEVLPISLVKMFYYFNMHFSICLLVWAAFICFWLFVLLLMWLAISIGDPFSTWLSFAGQISEWLFIWGISTLFSVKHFKYVISDYCSLQLCCLLLYRNFYVAKSVNFMACLFPMLFKKFFPILK